MSEEHNLQTCEFSRPQLEYDLQFYLLLQHQRLHENERPVTERMYQLSQVRPCMQFELRW